VLAQCCTNDLRSLPQVLACCRPAFGRYGSDLLLFVCFVTVELSPHLQERAEEVRRTIELKLVEQTPIKTNLCHTLLCIWIGNATGHAQQQQEKRVLKERILLGNDDSLRVGLAFASRLLFDEARYSEVQSISTQAHRTTNIGHSTYLRSVDKEATQRQHRLAQRGFFSRGQVPLPCRFMPGQRSSAGLNACAV